MKIDRNALERIYTVTDGDVAAMINLLQTLEYSFIMCDDDDAAMMRSLQALDPEEFNAPDIFGELEMEGIQVRTQTKESPTWIPW